MKTTKEKQITSYEQLVRICESFGARYKPTNDAIQPIALSSLLEQAQQSVKAVTVAQQEKTFVIKDRVETYAGIPKLATRIFHAMAASKASNQTLETAKQIRRGLKYAPPKTKAEKPGESTEVTNRSGNPAAQLNFEAQAKNFSRLLECVKTLPSYRPFEEDLKVEALEAYYEKLMQLNSEVLLKIAITQETQIKRNVLLYGDEGIYGTVQLIKHYVRGAFKNNSEEVKHVSRIRITNR